MPDCAVGPPASVMAGSWVVMVASCARLSRYRGAASIPDL
jgi:hypothetical protein